MFERIKKTIQQWKEEGVSSTEQEALLEALVLFMFADGKLKIEEQDKLDEFIKANPHQELHLNETISRVRKAHGDVPATERLLSELASKANSKQAATKLYQACEEMVTADRDIHDSEQKLLLALREKLFSPHRNKSRPKSK